VQSTTTLQGLITDQAIAVVAGANENRDIRSAYNLGVNSYIIKPINFEKPVDVAARDRYPLVYSEHTAH
jgi:response regulator of citrate/malate metabolism